MKVEFERVCGLDVHRDSVMAAVRLPDPQGMRKEFVQKFGTTTQDVLALRDWMKSHGVTHVAMEATGVLWKPVYYVLEGDFTLLLVNPAHIKNVPGRKTDVKDAQWIAQLLECGLLRASFVPPPEIRELRDLTRYRTELGHERTREVQRLHKVLQDAGIKLSSVATDIMGKSGRAMVEALIEGTSDPAVLADLAKGTLRKKLAQLRPALQGRFGARHAFLATELLAHLDYIEEVMERVGLRIEECLRPFVKEVQTLLSIPGVKDRTAAKVLAEIGANMKQFPDSKHLASWAGLCPGNRESAGKHMRCGTRKGNGWLKSALVESAWAATRKRECALSGQFFRLRARLGPRKAIVAVAHSILVIIYECLSHAKTYQELGHDHFDRVQKKVLTDRYVRKLRDLGYEVNLNQAKEGAA
ncbi:MAG: IS110 family transposase [Nitrospiraceae bacterium]